MKTSIISFGEIIWDIYEFDSCIGGAGLNFAAHCARCGADSFIFSALGKDELGKKAYDIISEFNINSDFVQYVDKKTGQCIVKLNEKSVPDFEIVSDAAYDNIVVSDEDISFINKKRFDALYFGTLIQRNLVSRKALYTLCEKCSFKEIVCDINLRKNCYDVDSVRFCLENATILKISEEEEPLLRKMNLYATDEKSLEKTAELICSIYRQIKYLIFTLGEKGSLIYCAENKEYIHKKAEKVKAVSTVGAGDSFFAAWITAYLSGETAETATLRATQLSGFVVSEKAAIPEYVFEEGILKTENRNTVLCDMHVHSRNSHDGSASVEEIAKACIKNNITVFAVTDHCDIEYYVENNVRESIKNSFEEACRAAKHFDGKVKILKGIEIGEGIWNKKYTDEILHLYDFDVIISSVHAVRYKNYTEPYGAIDFSEMSVCEIEGFLEKYFDEVLEMLQQVPCNIMAHLTCPLRYINGKHKRNIDIGKYEDKIEKILEYIINNSISMEINTSGLSQYGFFMPDKQIIKKYKEMGGCLISLGSDAHMPDNVGKDFAAAIAVLREYGFENYCYYQNQKCVLCKI